MPTVWDPGPPDRTPGGTTPPASAGRTRPRPRPDRAARPRTFPIAPPPDDPRCGRRGRQRPTSGLRRPLDPACRHPRSPSSEVAVIRGRRHPRSPSSEVAVIRGRRHRARLPGSQSKIRSGSVSCTLVIQEFSPSRPILIVMSSHAIQEPCSLPPCFALHCIAFYSAPWPNRA